MPCIGNKNQRNKQKTLKKEKIIKRKERNILFLNKNFKKCIKSILSAPNLSLFGFWILFFEFELSSPQVLAWFNKQRNPLSCFHKLCIRDKEVFFPTKVSWQNGKTRFYNRNLYFLNVFVSRLPIPTDRLSFSEAPSMHNKWRSELSKTKCFFSSRPWEMEQR